MPQIKIPDKSRKLFEAYSKDSTRHFESLEGPDFLIDILMKEGLSKKNAQKYINKMTIEDFLNGISTGILYIASGYFKFLNL